MCKCICNLSSYLPPKLSVVAGSATNVAAFHPESASVGG